jgi:hypothetical protein
MYQILVVFQFGAVVFLEPWRSRVPEKQAQAYQEWYVLNVPEGRSDSIGVTREVYQREYQRGIQEGGQSDWGVTTSMTWPPDTIQSTSVAGANPHSS